MLAKELLDRLQGLASLASDKEIGDIPVNLLAKDELKLIKKGAKEVQKCKKRGEVVTCIFEVWFPLAKIAHKLQWYKEAEGFYRAVIEHNPRFPDAWYYLGLLMDVRGRDILAREMFQSALDCAPPEWDKINHARLLVGGTPKRTQQVEAKRVSTTQQQEQHVIEVTRTKGHRGRAHKEPEIHWTGKCAICDIGVGNLGFKCHFCRREFCTEHRLPEKHDCPGSYRVTILHERELPTDPLQLITELRRIGKAAAEKAWVNISSRDVMESDFEILKHAHKKLLARAYEDLPQAKDFDLWFRAGKVAHCFHRMEIAEEFYKKALTFTTNREINENLGLVLKEQGKWREAEICFRKLIAVEPDHTNAWMNLGKVLDAQNRVDEAKIAFQTAIRQDPYKVRELLGDLRWSYAIPKERDEVLKEQIRGGRENARLWFSIGNNLYERGMWKEAEDAYQKGLNLDPNVDFAWNNLGLIMMDTGRFEAAEKYFRRAIELNPSTPVSYCNLGSLLRELGRSDEAIGIFQKVTEKFPDDAWGWLELGSLLMKIGRKAEGENALEKALRIDPNLKQYLPMILEMLRTGGRRKIVPAPQDLYS